MSINPTAWVKFESLEDNGGRFIVQPLERGMGHTIGNSLRRLLLSSLKGAAVSSVNVKGVNHEFTTLPGIEEDVLDIIFNIKGLVFKYEGDEPVTLRINKKGKGTVKGSDVECPSDVTIINPEHYIAQLDDKAELSMELTLATGIGFVTAESRQGEASEVDSIDLDTSFSPIVRVNYEVETIRIGKALDHDRLVLQVWTKGSIEPDIAVQKSVEIFKSQLELFNSLNEEPEQQESAVAESGNKSLDSVLNLSIDDLELSARSSNCLKRAGIETIKSLLEKEPDDLSKIKNFGKKSADEINDKLKQFNLSLKES